MPLNHLPVSAPKGTQNRAPNTVKPLLPGSTASRAAALAMLTALVAAACAEDETVPGPGLSTGSDTGRQGDTRSLDGGGFGAAEDATSTTADVVVDSSVDDAAVAVDTAQDATASMPSDATASTATDTSPPDTSVDAPLDSTSAVDATPSTDTLASETMLDATVIKPDATGETKADTADTFIGPVPSDIAPSQDSGSDAAVNPLTPEGQCKMKIANIVDLTGTDKCTQPDAPGFPGSGCSGTLKCSKDTSDPTCVCGN